jgi:hypothetical protein
MKTGLPHDRSPEDRAAARLEENDPVWSLLARARLPEPDAWFAARTVAHCRRAGLEPEPNVISMARMWRWALGGGLALCLALGLLAAQIHSQKVDKQKDVQEAFEIVASIDTDSDSSSSSPSWQDTSR